MFRPIGGGGSGAALGTSTPLALAAAAAVGVSALGSHEDHVHRLPYLAELNAWGNPTAWNASTNTPALASGIANATNTVFKVTTAGATTLDGISTWRKGDIAYFDGTSATWQRLPANPFDESTFAALGTGDFPNQLKWVTDVGNQPYIERWDTTANDWVPFGHMPYYVGAVITDTNSTGTQTLPLPNVAHPANFWRSGLGLLIELEAETNISATARTVQITVNDTTGAQDIVNLPAAANRRAAGRFGFVADGAASGWTTSKPDSNEYDWPQGANSNLAALTRTWANVCTIGGSVTFTTAVAAATAKVRRYKLYKVRG